MEINESFGQSLVGERRYTCENEDHFVFVRDGDAARTMRGYPNDARIRVDSFARRRFRSSGIRDSQPIAQLVARSGFYNDAGGKLR